MKIGIISDTHGAFPGWEKALKVFKDEKISFIIHAGDILNHGPRNPIPQGYAPAKLVESLNNSPYRIMWIKGNCDSEVDETVLSFPLLGEKLFLYINGKSILAMHGHKEKELESIVKSIKPDVVICGHSHIPLIEEKHNVTFINPGSPSLPKDNNPPTVAILDTTQWKAKIVKI